MPLTPNIHTELLNAALHGFEAQRQRIEGQIAEVRRLLNGRSAASEPAEGTEAGRRKRTMSAAARKRIAEAQRRRWAKFHKGAAQSKTGQSPAQTEAPRKKRKMSAAGRKAIAEANRRRFAALRKAKQIAAKSTPSRKKGAAKKARA